MIEFLTPVTLVIIGLLFAGLFSGYETGIYCLNRYRLNIRAARRDRAAMLVKRLVSRPHHLISSILLGTNISVYVATVALTSCLARQTAVGESADMVATVILAPIFFVMADVVPKNIFRLRADTLVVKYRWPVVVAHTILSVPAAILSAVGTFIGSIGAGDDAGSGPGVRADILFNVSEARERGCLSGFQDRAVLNVMLLSEKKLRDVMVPLDRVVCAPDTASVGEIRELMSGRCYSRVPVYSGGRDCVTGIFHILDAPLMGGGDEPVRQIIRSAFFLSADMPLHLCLRAMQSGRRHMVVAVDDGEPSRKAALGIATLKDIVEEIVGELAAW